jgi:hypothetical protein
MRPLDVAGEVQMLDGSLCRLLLASFLWLGGLSVDCISTLRQNRFVYVDKCNRFDLHWSRAPF